MHARDNQQSFHYSSLTPPLNHSQQQIHGQYWYGQSPSHQVYHPTPQQQIYQPMYSSHTGHYQNEQYQSCRNLQTQEDWYPDNTMDGGEMSLQVSMSGEGEIEEGNLLDDVALTAQLEEIAEKDAEDGGDLLSLMIINSK